MSKQRPSDKGRASALAISAWPLSRKVALALAIPLLLAATLGGLRVQADLEEASDASASAKQVTILGPAVDYLTAAERAMVAAQLSTDASRVELDQAVEKVKAAADDLIESAESAELTFEQRLQVDTVLDLSISIRDDNTASLSPDTWIAQLRQLQSGTTTLIATITSAQNTPEPRLELLAQTLGGRFSLAMQQALGSGETRSRSVSQALFSELGAESAAIDRLASGIDDAESAVRTLRANNGARKRSVQTGTSTVLGGSDAYSEYDHLAARLLRQVDQELASTAATARQRAVVGAAVTLAAVFAAILLALVISRSLLGPIRRVREGALQVANEELPDAVARIRSGGEPAPITPIDVHTAEEIGQLARAVDDLHRQAVTLATGEARLRTQVGEMFVTLSRRNTSLINQQLNLIETLEKDEEDPKRLESLFRLDHLASRMRRTSDSLLILADAPVRGTGWESLTVTEAAHAATAGVQDYQRVRISSTLETRIGEAAAGDLIHLLTELVDNALSYSSPSTHVTLSTAPAPGGLTMQVSDSGLGIPEESLRQINATLASGADVTPDTARRMGLFVVSRLATRHGIDVSLATNDASGITVTVFVPAAVLRDDAPEMPEGATPVGPVGPGGLVGEPGEEPAPLVPEMTDPAPAVEPVVEDPPAASATVIGLPTRQPGSTLSQRGPTSAGEAEPEVRETATPKPKPKPKPRRGAMPLRSRRALSEDVLPAAGEGLVDHAAGESPVDSRERETATPLASVSTLITDPLFDPLTDPLPLEPEAPTAPAALGAGLPTRQRGSTLSDQEAATRPFRDSQPTAATPTAATPTAATVAGDQAVETCEPEAPALADGPGAGLGSGLSGLPTRQRGGTLADQAQATSPFRASSVEVPVAPSAAPPVPAVPVATAALPTRQRGGTLADQDDANRAFRDGGLGTRTNVTSLSEHRDLSGAAGEAPVARTSPEAARRPTAVRASSLTRFRPASASRRASYEAAGGGPQQPLRTAVVEPGAGRVTRPASTRTALDGDVPVEPDTEDSGSIFGSLRSSWLTSEGGTGWQSREVEAGWQRAEDVAESATDAPRAGGLPIRRPGTLLVPGGITKPTTVAPRDPEAIRTRYAAYVAGVTRGRQTSDHTIDDQERK